jgi:hypothetical protein
MKKPYPLGISLKNNKSPNLLWYDDAKLSNVAEAELKLINKCPVQIVFRTPFHILKHVISSANHSNWGLRMTTGCKSVWEQLYNIFQIVLHRNCYRICSGHVVQLWWNRLQYLIRLCRHGNFTEVIHSKHALLSLLFNPWNVQEYLFQHLNSLAEWLQFLLCSVAISVQMNFCWSVRFRPPTLWRVPFNLCWISASLGLDSVTSHKLHKVGCDHLQSRMWSPIK